MYEGEEVCPLVDEHYNRERGRRADVLAEPVNLLTNIAFFAATIVSITFAINAHYQIPAILMSIGISIVGAMSTVFHAKPNKFTMYLDNYTITAWVLFYDYCWARYLMGYSLVTSILVVLTVIVFGLVVKRRCQNMMRGYVADYIPVLFMLITFGTMMIFKNGQPHILVALFLAGGALAFRVMDFKVKFPVGVHFMWHILNGFLMLHLTLYFAVTYNPV